MRNLTFLMNEHRFTLILSDVSEITSELADALYAATGGDIELNMRDGVAFLEFDRTSPSLREAVTSAISQVEGAGVGARVVRVESQAANTIAKINADLYKQWLHEQLQVGFDEPDRGQLAEWDLEAFLAKIHQRHAGRTTQAP